MELYSDDVIAKDVKARWIGDTARLKSIEDLRKADATMRNRILKETKRDATCCITK